MNSRRNPPAKWVLPDVVNPPTSTCYIVPVPDDKFHRAAFMGALLSLASAYKWADDADHTAREVALVWRNIFYQLQKCPPPPDLPEGQIEDFQMPIRVDCDCRVWITCNDGTEMELATVAMVNSSKQPGAGSPQPSAGGGSSTYSGCCDAADIWLIPTPVSTGDIITISDVSGAWTGNGGATWNCPDGEYYFAGACVGGGTMSGTDPLPTVKHMRLILQLAGDFYDLMAGPVTVPSGVDTVQGWLMANDDDSLLNSGQVCFTVEVENNEAPEWSHTLNFKTNTYGFVPNVDSGSERSAWVGGQGWTAIYLPTPNVKYSFIQRTCTPFTLTGVTPVFDMVGADAAASPNFVAYYDSSFNYNILDTVTNGLNQSLSWTGEVACDQLAYDLQVDQSGNTGTGAWIGLTVTGRGPDPFASYF